MADHTPSDPHGGHGHGEHGHHHVFEKDVLLKTFGVLVALTFLTVVLALFERGFVAAETFGFEFALPFSIPFGPLSVPIALGIAGVKVYWVASRFMGLKYEAVKTNTLVFLGSSSFLVIFFAFTWLDFAYRDTFEELSAVPTDIFEEEVLEAQEREAALEGEAAPLVNAPDPDLFGAPPPPAPAATPTE